jgi:aromatic-amino-acid transaminase
VRMREEFGVYALESGRICVAALNAGNIDYSADSIAKVLKG